MFHFAHHVPADRPASSAAGRLRVANALGRALRIAVACTLLAALPSAEGRVARPFDIATISIDRLPVQGRQVLQAIRAGGPFVSRRDGITFGNREGLLPREPRGYYAEYTVPTPGAGTRGARRIIAGRGTTGDFRTSNEYYYTNDHYQSFSRIVQ